MMGGAKGFTTGSAAAAASVAALRFLLGKPCSSVELTLPNDVRIAVPITGCIMTESGADAWVTKDAGDDPDVTHGAAIVSSVVIKSEPGVAVLGGVGVGVVTKPGLPTAVGEPAINPGPMKLICDSVMRELPHGCGAAVTLSIPAGEELAKRTYNPRLGIVKGLSVLGTTGIVSPMSSEAIIGTIRSELSMLRAAGADALCIAPGNYGRSMAENLGVPDRMIVGISNFVGEALKCIGELGFKKILLVGQVGKIAKLSAGSLDTHSSKSDGRLEAIAAYAGLCGAGAADIRRILSSTTADEAACAAVKTDWGICALGELVRRAAERAEAVALQSAAELECACLTFALPDVELARTDNSEKIIMDIRAFKDRQDDKIE